MIVKVDGHGEEPHPPPRRSGSWGACVSSPRSGRNLPRKSCPAGIPASSAGDLPAIVAPARGIQFAILDDLAKELVFRSREQKSITVCIVIGLLVLDHPVRRCARSDSAEVVSSGASSLQQEEFPPCQYVLPERFRRRHSGMSASTSHPTHPPRAPLLNGRSPFCVWEGTAFERTFSHSAVQAQKRGEDEEAYELYAHEDSLES
jgi:hypothetical protein